jgi:hypothetical protein
MSQEEQQEIESLVDSLNGTMVVSNYGKHWRIYIGNECLQWWPTGSRGKMYHSTFGKLPPVKDAAEFLGVLNALFS